MYRIIIVAVIFSAFIVLMVFLAFKKWLYSWEGVLEDKQIKREQGFEITDDSDFSSRCIERYFLIFKTTKGKKIKREVSKEKFKSAIIGERYVKFKKSWKFIKHS